MASRTTILQSFKLRASPEQLFEMYMDEEKHSSITGAPAKITRNVGGKISAYDGYITGTTLLMDSPRTIVQTWRGSDWNTDDPDSILILTFKRINSELTQIDMIHANVPGRHYAHLNEGWKEHYWNKWKKQLRSVTSKRAKQKK